MKTAGIWFDWRQPKGAGSEAPSQVSGCCLEAFEDLCAALFILALLCGAGWLALGSGGARAVSGVNVAIGNGHE